MKIRGFVGLVTVLALWLATSARAGWMIELVTRTEGKEGPSSRVILMIEDGRVREMHTDGTFYLWNVPEATMVQVDPETESYSGGPVDGMIRELSAYLDTMRQKLAAMSPEEREALAEQTGDMPMPVPPPERQPKWTVRETDRTDEILGHAVRLFEVYRDDVLSEERWIATELDLAEDLDVGKWQTLRNRLESVFADGMGQSFPRGPEIGKLREKGLPLRTVYLGEAARVVREATRIVEKEISPKAYELPEDFEKRDGTNDVFL